MIKADLIASLEGAKEDQRIINLSLAALRESTNHADIYFSIRSIHNFAEMAEDHLARIIHDLNETLEQEPERKTP